MAITVTRPPGTTLMGAAATLFMFSLSSRIAWTQEAEEPCSPNAGAVSFDLGANWASAYYFRGFLQEEKGSIIQPWAEINIDLMESDTMSLSSKVGTWNSFHSRETAAGDSNVDSLSGDWYESDFYAGFSLKTNDLTIGLQYITYVYPSNDASSSIDEMILSLGYDDTGLFREGFALNPSVALAIETHDRGGTEESYFEMGVAPRRNWRVKENAFLSVTVPLRVGISVDDYYTFTDVNSGFTAEDSVGFWEVGLDLGYDIPVAAKFGGWTFNVGLHYLSLSESVRRHNFENFRNYNRSEVVSTIGLGFSY